MTKVTPQIIRQMRSQRAQGRTLEEIGNDFGIVASTVKYWLDDENYRNHIRYRCLNRYYRVQAESALMDVIRPQLEEVEPEPPRLSFMDRVRGFLRR